VTRLLLHILAGITLLAAAGCRPGDGDPPPVFVNGGAPTGDTFRSVVEAVFPSIVYIQTEARVSPGGLESLFPGLQPEGLFPTGGGSGVIFSADGLILTNNHVVQDAERVLVTTYDRRQFEAQVVARDPSTDVAVVRIDARDLPVARLSDSDQLAVGDWVLALGSPMGLQFTATAGIVSAVSRTLNIIQGEQQAGQERQAAPLENFIQTDAAINPGNSGGPLVNMHGEVVGINTAILAGRGGGFTGYGFAIPANLARRVADQLVRFGEVRRPYLGVRLREVTAASAEVYGLPRTEGVEIRFVEEGSPAAAAGIELGDVVVGIEGRRVGNVAQMQGVLAQLEPGGTASMRLIRYGEEIETAVRLGMVRSGVAPVEPLPRDQPAAEPRDPLGFSVGVTQGRVVVASVRLMSAAARAGVQPGQVIEQVNRRPVRSAEDVRRALEAARRDVVSLIVDDPQQGRVIINYRMQ
jgi:serine protease Do